MKKEHIEVLRQCELFDGVVDGDIENVVMCFNPSIKTYSKNEIIKMSADNLTEIGIVLEGVVSITKENAAGERSVIAMLDQGHMFGEIAVFSGQERWPATVTTVKAPCTIMFIGADRLVTNCQNRCVFHTSLIHNMLKILSQSAIRLNKKIEYMSMKSIRGKLSAYVLDQCIKSGNKNMFIMPLNRNELADFLNITRPSLSREMSKMKDEGLIDYFRDTMQIVDKDGLKTYVE